MVSCTLALLPLFRATVLKALLSPAIVFDWIVGQFY